MPRYRMISFSRPVPGREDDYNHWYQHVHLPEIMPFPGMIGAQRFHVSHFMAGDDSLPYVAIYELETDDIDGALAAINDGLATGRLTMTDAVDGSLAFAVVARELGERVTAA